MKRIARIKRKAWMGNERVPRELSDGILLHFKNATLRWERTVN